MCRGDILEELQAGNWLDLSGPCFTRLSVSRYYPTAMKVSWNTDKQIHDPLLAIHFNVMCAKLSRRRSKPRSKDRWFLLVLGFGACSELAVGGRTLAKVPQTCRSCGSSRPGTNTGARRGLFNVGTNTELEICNLWVGTRSVSWRKDPVTLTWESYTLIAN